MFAAAAGPCLIAAAGPCLIAAVGPCLIAAGRVETGLSGFDPYSVDSGLVVEFGPLVEIDQIV